ncbi:MAG: hypothetical protein KGJ93_04595, partial [Patescibacteria group bacterium]|nr:hypothetical protein [Patescibacteria group bacterium]
AVPKEAVAAQKSLLEAYQSYGQLLTLSQNYTAGQNQVPWADVYGRYLAINQSFKNFVSSYDALVSKYQIADAKIGLPKAYADAAYGRHGGFSLIPRAQALFGLGDVTITVGDVPRLIMDAVQEGLVSSFSQFMASFLSQMVQKIESNYLIANFLYYSDALVSGEYANDYLAKYVPDKLDQQIVRQFIPQFSCNQQNQNFKTIFQARASQYLGFNPDSLDPSDPQYYQKLARVGDFMSSPTGWEQYYEDLAAQAESQAQVAIDRELSSSGLKSPRDGLKNSIVGSINSIAGGEKASLQAIMQLGISNASSFVSKFVAQITQTLLTQFIFSGASNGPRSPSTVGVLKEQSTCLAAGQLTPIVPIAGTQYQTPPPAPSSQDIIDQACAQLPRGCDLGASTTPAN